MPKSLRRFCQSMASPEVNSNDKTQIIDPESKMAEERTFKMMVACVVFAMIIAVLSLIISFVAITMKGTNQYNISTGSSGTGEISSGSSEDKIWMFQIGHYQSNTQYLDEASGTIQGYNVDVVNAVCQIANKNCELVYDVYGNCWESQVGETARGGFGIMARWYDACVGWTNTYDRARTFRFSDDFEKPVLNALWIKKGGSLPSFPDLAGLKIGFNDGWQADEHCLSRYSDLLRGFDSSDSSQVLHYVTEEDIKTALVNDEIDVFFASIRSYTLDDPRIEILWNPGENRCIRGGLGMMMQKDQVELETWWNTAFDRLRTTGQYNDICDRLKTAHGDQPGLDPEYVCVD
ncbi:putative ABC transporter arginine-binding protein 2 [Apostichopus japonicus]|uniref:putative ABC transporter arginine-binding protein 2 n=1 Tax=Stichopus japonicus TaxID=307972 RepID=UPI003AB59199